MNGYEIEHNLELRLRNWSLNPIAQLLYLKLKIIANEQGLITQKFKVSNSELEFRVGISKGTLNTARTDLIKSGILGYKTGGKDGCKKTFGEYWFIDLRNLWYNNYTTNDTTTDTTNDTTNVPTNDLHNNEHAPAQNSIINNINNINSINRGGVLGGGVIPTPTNPPPQKSENEKTDFEKLNNWLKKECPHVAKMRTQLTEKNMLDLIEDYGKECLVGILESMENKVGVEKKYNSVNLTARKWLEMDIKKQNN
ncbi:hypothetical protein FACS189434_09260 [Bacteroidia bacterium]|nr:hypothetical protein FACS189434_09260 [Bacteroidia bacterium]